MGGRSRASSTEATVHFSSRRATCAAGSNGRPCRSTSTGRAPPSSVTCGRGRSGRRRRAAAEALGGQFDLAPSAIREIVATAAAEAPITSDADTMRRLWDASVASTRVRPRPSRAAASSRALAGRTSSCPTPRWRCCGRSPTRWRTARASTRTGDSRERMSRGLGISGAVRRRRAAPARRWPPRCSRSELRLDLYRIDLSAGREQVHRRDREEPAPRLRRGRGRRRDAASSTRPTRCSASAARSRTATTATPTSRSTTCSSAWRATAGSRSSRPTCSSALDQAFLRRLRFVVDVPVPGRRRAPGDLGAASSPPDAELRGARL